MKFVFILFFFMFNAAVFAQVDTASQMANFSNGVFSLQYPATWDLDTSKRLGTALFVFSPLEDEEDKFKENINILIQDLTGQDIDLVKYKEITDKQLTDLLENAEVYESSVLKSAKGEYYRTSYSFLKDNFGLRVTSLCYIRNNKAYLITFSTELAKFDRYKETGEAILNSFKLVD